MKSPLPTATVAAIDEAFAENRRTVLALASAAIEKQRVGLQLVFDAASSLLTAKGYVMHNGDAQTGEISAGGRDWWFTFTQGGDVECGDTFDNLYGATQDALLHWFRSSLLDIDLGDLDSPFAPTSLITPTGFEGVKTF